MKAGEFTVTKSYEPDMECMVKALKVVLKSSGKQENKNSSGEVK